jgi:pimeloyl-ACP methyl ester carboxylesterase
VQVFVGMSMGMVAGAGLALADDGSTPGAGGKPSSESSNSTGKKPDSDKHDSKPDPKTADKKDAEDQDATVKEPSDSASNDDAPPVKDIAEEKTPKKGSDHDAVEPAAHEAADVPDESSTTVPKPEVKKEAVKTEARKADPEDAKRVVDAKDADEPDQAESSAVQAGPVDEAVAAAKTMQQTEATAAFAFAAAEPVVMQPARPTLINVVGSFFWGLFDLFTKVITGPPVVPPGSMVTAGRSKLQIDCGDGYTADADWYFPTEGEPDKFVYFQHGFPGNAAVYNLTLTELAERNNAVVVAPTITGDIFACDACNLTGDPMHAAVAKLFEGDREALLASAQAAGYEGTLPEQFVFVGQSHGGQLAAGASRYFKELAPAAEKSNLVGAVLFDSSAAGGALARALEKLPPDFPVLHISGAPALLNTFGSADAVFQQKRPGQFNGIQLIGGTHSDGYRSSAVFGVAQFVVALVTGPSRPENVEAVQVLTQGWITNMYADRVYDPMTRTGIYGVPGEPGETIVDIPTDAGVAHGYVLPAPRSQVTTLLSLVLGAVFELPTLFNFDRCAVDPSEVQSLAVSQHVCTA